MNHMRYFIKTFGCQMNHSDSERIAGFLEIQPHPNPLLSKEREFKPTKDIHKADLVIFNTCGVRQMAEDRVYGQIHNLRKKHPETKIVLTGCLANRKDVQRRLKNKVDLFCEIKDFPEIVGTDLVSVPREQRQALPLQENYLKIIPKYSAKHTAYVPIMTGCNNFCSYCVVPYARGREVSRPAEEIIGEIKLLVKRGYKKIILLGQNVNSYNDKKINFSKLLKKINSIPGNFWIWFISNHPKDFSLELIETMTKCRKVCECVHLPIQAGDDKILENMNRKYTAREYLAKIEKIKKAFAKNKPGKLYSITSDIIVGFPGETKKQFLESAKIMEKVGYSMVYFGQFSPRPGTMAAKMKDNVKKSEKVRREKYLNEILKKTSFSNNKKYENKIIEVLVNEEKNGNYFGHTRTMKNVKITSAKKNITGKIVRVKVTKANVWNLEGVLKK